MSRLCSLVGLILVCAAAAMGQEVQGVHPGSTPLQVGVGYTFVSFHEYPGNTRDLNGGEASVVYYRDWVGVEGEFSDAFASINGSTEQLLFGGGGLRVRWQRPQGFEPWAHLLVGGAHLSPKLLNDSTEFGFKAGAGIDLHPQHGRIGFRASVDLLGTQFFGTYQMSPQVSAGIIFSLGPH